MSTLAGETYDTWWKRLRPRLMIAYSAIALLLLCISGAGHLRLLSELDATFGGFFWTIDPDHEDKVVVVSTPPQFSPFEIKANSLINHTHIVTINNLRGAQNFTRVYKDARPGESISYTLERDDGSLITFQRAATRFTFDTWWQNYGLTLLAGMSWLLVGAILLATAPGWNGAVEGMTLFPPAMLFLLYSHWGNVQAATQADLVSQLLWIPSFALLGAAFIHLSLTYRPEALYITRSPRMQLDMLPYLPILALLAYEWISYALTGSVQVRVNMTLSLGYATFGGLVSLGIGTNSLLRIGYLKLGSGGKKAAAIPLRTRQRIGDLLTLWIGGVGLGFCLGVLPILLTGQPLLSLPTFYILASVYPLILLYAIRSLRLMGRLHATLEQREEALREQQRTAGELLRTNQELQRATSLLLHADAHLRSILSQRLHDQPKQQALRIRSLLGHWQHKLRVEAERDPEGKVEVQPVIEALGKVRKISEELEGDLRGLQLLVEDAYQRRSLGLKLHLEKLIREDLPALHPESPLQVQADLWALDAFSPDLEQTEQGERIAEAISYTVTQALLNIYNHAGATFATVRTVYTNGWLEVLIKDNGHGFDPQTISPEKTSLFKAQLKTREAGGNVTITSVPRPNPEHGTTILLRIPLPQSIQPMMAEAPAEPGDITA